MSGHWRTAGMAMVDGDGRETCRVLRAADRLSDPVSGQRVDGSSVIIRHAQPAAVIGTAPAGQGWETLFATLDWDAAPAFSIPVPVTSCGESFRSQLQIISQPLMSNPS